MKSQQQCGEHIKINGNKNRSKRTDDGAAALATVGSLNVKRLSKQTITTKAQQCQ